MPGATIARPAVAEKRLTVNAQGKVVYLLKTPYRDGTTHVVLLRASCPPPLRGQPSAAQNRSRRFCRAARLHCKIGGVGAAPEGEPHAIPRCTRTEPPLACGGDAGRKGQGEECGCSAREVRDRAACGDELGTAAEAGLWHRRGELRALRFCGQGDRQHRGAGADRTDPGACARERRKQRGIARPTIDRAAGECVSGAGEGGRIGSREAAIRDRQGAVLRAAEMRRDPGDCSGCEGRCAFPGWSCRQDQFAGWIPFRGPGAGAGRTGLALGGALSFLYLPRESRRGWRGG